MGSRSKLVLVFSIVLAFAAFAGAVSIQTLQSPYDSQIVSPNSQVAQVVKLLDAEGEPINESSLENRSSLQFSYVYKGNQSPVEHLSGGYYYGLFSTGQSVEDIEFEIIDNSVAGELNETEELETGNLDVDILTNLSDDYEANEEITVKARVEDLTDYKYLDSDGSGDLSPEDVVVVDRGGEGRFSKEPDPVFAGVEPDNRDSLSAENPWDNSEHQIAFNDSTFGNAWSSGSDLILLDYHSGGTVSVTADETLNTGSNSQVDTPGGTELKDMSEIDSSIFFISSDSSYEGEPVVHDNDSDGQYTADPDTHIAGEVPSEGAQITHEDSMPDEWEISSYDSSGGGEWNPDQDFLAVDHDNDSLYTVRQDTVIGGDAPEEGTELSKEGYGNWNDEDTSVPTEGDLEVHDEYSGDDWDPSVDAIWIENGSTNGYQSSDDTAVAPESIDEGTQPNKTSDLFSQWDSVSAYDEGDGSSYDPSVDAIIKDFNGGGTYSEREDTVIAGNVETGFSGGTPYTVVDGFVSDWELDARQPVEDSPWSSSTDTILMDRNEGGTYSTSSDTVINAEGEDLEDSGGSDLQELNEVSSNEIKWADVDNDGRYDGGDEIFRDLDEDNQYTSQPDEHLAGVSLGVAGQGTPLRITNNWQYYDKEIKFKDAQSGDEWDSSEDSIIRDIDEDDVYTGRSDTVVRGSQSDASAGDILSSTDRTDFTTPDILVRITSGTNTTEAVQLGRGAEGNYTGTVTLPNQDGTSFLLQAEARDSTARVYGLASQPLETRTQGIGFSVQKDEVNLDYQRRGEYSKNVTVQNLLETQNTINISVTDELQNVTNLSTEQVSMSPNGNDTFTMEFNLTDLESYSGEAVLTETASGIEDTVDIEINGPECSQEAETFCRTGSGDIDVTAEERTNITRTVELLNLAEDNQTVEISENGNITSYTTITEQVNLTDEQTISIKFRPETPGNFSGSIDFTVSGETVSVNTSLEADLTELETDINVQPSEVSFGAVPSGNDQSIEVMTENTGTLGLENLSVSSEDFSVSAEAPQTVSSSESSNFSVTLSSLETESGTITVSAQSDQSTVEREISVSASLIPPASEMESELRSQVRDLRSQASATDTLNQLTEVETQISSIQSQWDQGNYQRANEIYNSATSTLNSVETQIESSSQNQNGGGTGQQDPQQGTGENQSEGGGMGIIVVLILLILILGAGFVVYTSYYPEEGDPLYDVLGDRE